MLFIIGSLLGAWILALFNFDAVIIEGMMQIFGVTINKTGYYFLFALVGILKNVLSFINRKPLNLKFKEVVSNKKKE